MESVSELNIFDKIFTLLKNENLLQTPVDVPVINFLHPHELQQQIDFDLESPLKEPFEELCKKIIKYSVKTRHPHFYNQLYGGVDLYGLAGTWISESLNTNQHTFEVAPVFSLMEKSIINHVIKKIDYEIGDGIFSPGGSISNMYGLALARFKLFPDIKSKGLHSFAPLVAYTSEDAHYSLDKGMHWLGLGTDNLIKIKTDNNGRIIPEVLEKEIQKTIEDGKVPFFVNATAGTTVLGAFDPIDKIADICLKYKIWLHVDACFGGTLLFSNKYKNRLNGIHRSDSVAWNPHKMLGAPLQCSLFITKYQNLMQQCNSAGATYLFQQDKFYDVSYDTGDKSIQCGRKTDAFKLWLMWKLRGDIGFEKLINNTLDCSNYFKNQINAHTGFRLVMEEFECTNICFWYIPTKMRNLTENQNWWQQINKVAPAIKEKMTKEGILMIGYTPLQNKGLCNFFRIVFTCHPPPTYADMDFVIKEITRYGEYL